MVGILASSSTTGNTVGASRTLSYNANIISNRGYLKPGNKENMTDINMGNALSVGEMCSPLVANHDSPMRVNMLTAQSKQSIPIKKSNKLLIKNGAENAISHSIGKDFIFTASDDGEVIDYDEKNELMFIQYKNGKKDTINLSKQTVKNGGGGFYLINQLTTKLKVGSKFKKNEVLAKDESFFKENADGTDNEFAMSRLAKIAIYAGDFTHEDSSLVTEELCKDLTTNITMKKEKILGKNANVDFIVKKGQYVKTGEPLLVFEQGYVEEEINVMLSKIASDLDEEITKMSKNQLVSKYTGIVNDIKIYHTCEVSEMSPSLQKLVKGYNSTIINKEKMIKKYYDNSVESGIILPPNSKIVSQYGKVKGNDMPDSVMIEFYVTYEDELGVGDKISYYTALKSVISTKVPKELAPYSELHKDEKISAIMSYISVNARMTCSIYYALYGNKVLVELKKQISDIWNNK